ncbi:uncharacterized protein LOC117122951 [Anneissia japonica]|uniref:uncharacterized protein LOC117122951 n=1 Tax=Anneissia japonica TaxID=1529436 RepID=UPI001425AEC1|nr:uncharacterized protein LOC117122951 [Anneissia japonica]
MTLKYNCYRSITVFKNSAWKWKFATTKLNLPIDKDFSYHYVISTWCRPFFSVKDVEIIDKTYRKVSSPSTTYDVFKNEDSSFQKEKLAQGTVVYADMELDKITEDTLKESLMATEKMQFPGSCHKEHIRGILNWIEDTVHPRGYKYYLLTDSKIKYMTVLLAKVIQVSGELDKHVLNAECIRLIIHRMQQAKLEEFPTSVGKNLAQCCTWLVNAVQESWIHTWVYFYKLFDVKTLMNMETKASLQWTNRSWEVDKGILQHAFDTLKDPMVIKKLVTRCLEEIQDTRVLKKILVLSSVYIPVKDGNEVMTCAVNQLDRILRSKMKTKFKLLYEIWQDMASANLEELTHIAKTYIVMFLRDETWPTRNKQEIKKAILSSHLYTTSYDLRDVIQNMVKQTGFPDVYETFMEIIRQGEILACANEKEIQTLFEICITSFAQQSKTRRSVIKVRLIYRVLALTTTCDHLSSYEHLKKNIDCVAYGVVNYIPLDIMFSSLIPKKGAECDWQPVEVKIMAQHIRKRLCDDKKSAGESKCHVKELRGKDGMINVLSIPIRDVLLTLLDIQELPFSLENMPTARPSAKFEAAIKQLVSDGEFWLIVLTALGQYGDEIRQHQKCKAVIESLSAFSVRVFAKNITVKFVRQCLFKNKDTLIELMKITPSKHTTDCKSLKQQFKHISHANILLCKRLDNLCHLLKCVEHLAFAIQVTDDKDVAKRLQELQRENTAGSVTLKETSEEAWWGHLFPLVPYADAVQIYVNSMAFLNICRSILEGTCSDVCLPSLPTVGDNEEDEDDDDSEDKVNDTLHPVARTMMSVWNQHEAVDTLTLASLLKEVCIPTFQKHFHILLSANLDVSTQVVQSMMEGVTDQERLNTELTEIRKIFGKPVPRKMVQALTNFVELPDLIQRSCQLKSMFGTFGVDDDDEDDIQSAIKQLASLQAKENLTLQQLQDALQTVSGIEKDFTSDDWDIIEQLASSQELIDFLSPLVDEDLRNLIDAVEERSEQHVDESTVSNLIDVKRYLEALLKVHPPQQGKKLIEAIKENRQLAIKVKGLPTKIDSCVNNVHGLRDLYNNVANRGEMTKEIIYNALQQGVYQFRLNEESGSCSVVLSYKRGNTDQISQVSYGLNQLNDLRSRALLIVNTRKNIVEATAEEQSPDHTRLPVPNFEEFVSCVNMANDIKDLCNWLHGSGHFSFRHFEETVHSKHELENLKTHLKSKFKQWQAVLKEARERYYFLNFFHSKQLLQLDQFFQGYCLFSEDLTLLLRFVDTDITFDDNLTDAYHTPPDNKDLKARLFHLGMALEKIFSQRLSPGRHIPGKKHQLTKSTLDTKVRKGNVFVAELEEDSTKTIPVLLRLYSNTTGVLPEPSHVIFCHHGTSWEEIALFLQRSTGASIHFKTNKLFVLANVELLPTETQFQLVTEVKRIQEHDHEFLLAIICRGGSYHHIIDQFSPNFTHCLHGFTDAEMSSCLCTGWPEVEVVTSSQPGLGKTEYIRDLAFQKNLGVRSMPVSGPIAKEVLVEQLKAQAGMPKEVLHIDVSTVSDPQLLDTFLFEVVVLGMAVSGTHICLTPTKGIVMEVANTQKDKLRNSLTICSSFSRTHLEWRGFNHFITSKEVNSPLQVVCHYLKALQSSTLDNVDIVLTGPNHVSPIPPAECRQLLENCLGSNPDLSYTIVNSFLEIFAQELRRMSASLYFTTGNLKAMLGNGSNDVRSKFVQALLEVSKDFTARSVKNLSSESQVNKSSAAAALVDFRGSTNVSAFQMVARMQGMVKWADSNHLLVVFHRQDSQTISTLYRVLSKVPSNISKLFETQMKRKLPDYNNMSQTKLHTILEKVCRSTRVPFKKEKLQALRQNYALTPDNLLKMILVHMRIKAHIPVIIMGETGCGKTTLITYLARICEVAFEILNLHAGISEENIIDFVSSLQAQANKNLKQEVWGFLDEINTCDHLGLLNEIICHHSLKGQPLSNNLIFIAACNPYTLRESTVISAGLESKHRRDEMSKLVYRVHPLPETMMDFVWDYGSLDKKDEEAYICRMLEAKDNTFVELVVMSQDFMREVEQTTYCVSLRDVNRCQHLANWFTEMLKKKKVANVKGDYIYINKVDTRSMILALAHCYHSRLTKAEDRKTYRKNIAAILGKAKPTWNVTETDIECMIRAEQLNILERMQLPDGIAKNEALRENVFVMLVSIMNRIPVFVVGKPGCSKSLSMQLIRSNLRGADSKDYYFKSLPPVYVVSYQGSESSTSEGIIKVFDKAKNYKKHNPDVMPVVLLDEIGLAEVSSFNPLKVLHSQLEPTVGGFPPVAVVGISNWALDAAKMNRAIHLSRPEPTIDDLENTAKSIRDDSAKKKSRSIVHHTVSEDKLRKLAEAYSDYQVDQMYTNFHGLRDYYSLVKYIAIQSSEQLHGDPGSIIEQGILRNFGGLKHEMSHIINNFMEKINILQQHSLQPGTMDLIKENMDDAHARHLMLITSGDSALNILEQTLKDRDHVTIFGSRFENDISEEYSYTTLSEIILCMERGVTLVLRDLENIYGSLYDMLNQNYTIVGKKRNCRVALGPYSNPMCHVHRNFRCIVLVDEQKVDYQNPPFLNRFEKQTLRFNDILTDHQVETIGCILSWMNDICYVEGFQFSQESMFLGLHNDTLPSLVYLRSKDSDLVDIKPPELARLCQKDLMRVACPDAVLRASKSRLAEKDRNEVEAFQRSYFELPMQNGLREFFENRMLSPHGLKQQLSDQERVDVSISCRCTRTVIYTHSSIHADVRESLNDLVTVQVEKLSKFKSERQFAAQMHHFWHEADEELLVLQCITSHDAAHMLLAKNRIDQYRSEYLNVIEADHESSVLKHACIIVHIDRGEKEDVEMFPWQFNFLCGWEQFTLDTLEPTKPPLDDLLQGSVSEMLAGLVDLDSIIQEQLLWSFSCMKYENQSRDVNSAMKLAADVAKSHDVVSCLKMQILEYIKKLEKKYENPSLGSYTGWQVDVASNPDLLYRCSTLGGAILEYIKQCVKEPLARSIILLERSSAWTGSPLSTDMPEDTVEFWQTCIYDQAIFDITAKDIPEPRGPESCLVDCRFLELKYPFFRIFHEKIESNKDWLLHESHTPSSSDHDERMECLIEQLAAIVAQMPELHHEEYFTNHIEDYIHDLYNTVSSEFAPNMPCHMRVELMKWLLTQVTLNVETRADVKYKVAREYVAIWLHMKLLAAEIQLMSIYKDVTGRDPKGLLEDIQRMLDGVAAPTPDKTGDNGDDTEDDAPHNANVKDSDEDVEIHEGESIVTNNEAAEVEDVDVTIHPNTSAEPREDSAVSDTSNDSETAGGAEDTKVIQGGTSLESIERKISKDEPSEQINESGYSLISPSDEPAETLLVTKICKDILPTKQVLQGSGGVCGWQRNANCVLLLAGQVSADSAVLHFLRLCRDFVVMLSDNFNITGDYLVQLGALARHVEDPLASEEVFEFIIETVEALRTETEVESHFSTLDNFLSSYFGLCLEADLDTPLLPQIIDTLCGTSGKLILGSRPVLMDIIRSDIDAEPDQDSDIMVEARTHGSVCEQLILSGELDEEQFPNLASIDQILTGQQVDSSLSTVCCDIIQDVAFKHVTCDYIANVQSDTDTIWEIASHAVRIIEDKNEEHSSLKFAAAAAFIRAFIKAAAELIHVSDVNSFKAGDKYFVIANMLNGLFKLEENGRCESGHSLPQMYLLKCLREAQPLCDLRKLCSLLADPITNLNKIEWQENLFTTRLGYSPLTYVDHYSDALAAIAEWQTHQNKTKMEEFLASAQANPSHRLAFLAAVANTFYFIQTTQGLKDVDKQQALSLFESTKGFSNVYRQFLERLLGLADFTGILHLSESSPQEDIEIASVVVHLNAIILSYADNKGNSTAFMTFLDQSTPISKMALLVSEKPCTVFKTPHAEKPKCYDCQCGLKMVGNTASDLPPKCLVCDRTRKRNESVSEVELHRENIHNYIPEWLPAIKSTESVRGLSPVAYQTINILVHSCFLAGICSTITTEKQIVLLSNILKMLMLSPEAGDEVQGAAAASKKLTQDGSKEGGQDITPTAQDVSEYIATRLKENWYLIRDAIQLNFESVSIFLHRVIRACKQEIVSHPYPKCLKDKEALEDALSNIIIFEVKDIPGCLLQQKRDCLEAEGVDINCLESKLEELDDVQAISYEAENPDKDADETNNITNIHVRCLLRRRQEASLHNFRSQFANMCQSSENKYPFLQLCLSKLEIIKYVRYLPDFLKWNSVVIGRLNHVIKRDEAKRMKVGDFLSNDRFHPNETAKKTATNAFTAFQKAWNQVRDGWSKLTGASPDFDNMTFSSNITECVVDKKDPNCDMRQMIRILLDVQNAFLMDALAIAIYGRCPALLFLIKDEGVAGIQTMPLYRAGPSIIEFEWSNKLLVFHDIGTEYGHGSVIRYKYTVIERELARILVLNKAYLVEGSALTQFAYSDELFHACSVILSAIGSTIFQRKLPKELINSIMREQDHRQTFAKDMLDHLEVILVLLKKTGGDPGSSLHEYIKRWQTLLPESFPDNLLPEPRDGVKLQHVVHLYEILEDLLVDAVVESLRDDFRSDIPERSADHLGQKLKPLTGDQLEESAATLRRFIFRFLRSGTKTDTNSNLKDLIVRSAQETMDCTVFTDLLHYELEVKHVVKILEFIDKQIEQRKDAYRKKDIQQSRPRVSARGAASTGGKTRPKRRGGMGGVS